MRYVIIGNSIASAGCIEGIRRVDSEGEIIIISDEPYHIYSRPLISYWLSKKVKDISYRPVDYYEKYRVTPILGKKVIQVDFESKEVILENGEKIKYDKLLIATGGKPFIPNIPGLDKKNIFTFIRFDDVKKINEVIFDGAKVIVIGAGLSGLKAVEALIKRNCKVTVVELAGRILGSILDEDGARMVQEIFEEKGVIFLLENSVVEIFGEEKVREILLKSGEALPADILIFAIGVVPNVDIFRGTKLKINRGILVNERMETNIPDVYSAGDVVEALDLLTNEDRVIPILPNAYMQGEIAGLNMAGREVKYSGSFSMNSIGFFDVHIMSAGIINPPAEVEVIKRIDLERKIYRKLYIRGGKILGFMFINSIDRTGMIVDLIKNRIDVSNFKDRLLSDNFGFLDLPKEFRKEKILGV
ncbi:MAG: FAD-dependent oxidoreductase [bacterium]|nr:FAD-dependent oxidoreductase [bacterium]